MTKTYGLSHLAVAVSDLTATLEFYTQVFEMTVMYQNEHMIQLTTPGNHDILVFEKSNDPVDGKTGGIAHYGFRLKDASDVHDVYKRILEAGGEIVGKGEFIPGSPYIFFKDPDGYMLEVWYEVLPDDL